MQIKIKIFLILILITHFTFAQQTDSLKIARTFELGEIKVTSLKTTNVIKQEENIKLNQKNVSKALSTLPSVILQNIGGRNELSVIIRGFDIRGIPVYIDGIPVYVTYDGYVDLGRFTTFSYAKISATKGFTPMEFGPNTIGGSINLVSLKPTEKLDLQVISGTGSGNYYEYGFNVGSRINKFYFQGNYYGNQSDYFPLSRKYKPTQWENGGKRENSYSNDQKVNLKFGFTPNAKSEYTVNFVTQWAKKGTPPYSGNDPLQPTRFWQWPAWNKTSLYFISKTTVSNHSDIKIRLYYDKFYNKLKSFDNETYSTQIKKYSFTSIYDDHTWGGNTVFTNTIPKKNKLNLSLHYKNDYHKEHNDGEPIRNFNDFTFSVTADDEFTVTNDLNIITGLAWNIRKNLKAEDYNSNTGEISNFPDNENKAVNAQLVSTYSFSKNSQILAYIAHRTRFATLKDRYSYRLGRNIPNPGLKAEQALHYNLTYKALLFSGCSIDGSIYYINLNNTIQLVDNVEPGISQMQNTGEAVFKGFEIASNYNFSDNLKLDLNYSFIERKNKSNPGLLFTDVPKHKIWADLTLIPVKNIKVDLNAQYYSYRYSTTYGTVDKAFDLYNLYTSYDLSRFTIYAGLQNLLDKDYAYSEGFPAPGRNAFVKLLYQLNK